MDYAEAIRWLYALAPRGMRYELDRMEAAVALRGHPERRVPAVHVAGTNGKGSVTTLVAAGLRASGRRVGLFTSPHLHHFTERFRLDGRPASRRVVARHLTELRRFLERPDTPELSFFETAALLAFELFAARGCDVAVYEVGLGGRLDATNVLRPEVTAITRIALDHTRILGDTLGAIAGEKAGIVERGVPLVAGVREPEAVAAIRDRARRRRAPTVWLDRDFAATPGTRPGRVTLRLPGGRTLDDVHLRLAGAHQRDNAAIAAAVLDRLGDRGLPVDDDAIRRGFAAARWPGRLERLRGAPPILLDAAHNEDGCAALAAHVAALPSTSGRRVLLFGALGDKRWERMLDAVAPAFPRRVYAAPPMHRALAPETLAARHPGTVARSVPDALARARRAAGPEGLVVVAGSLFLVAAVRARVLGIAPEPAVRG